MKYNPICPVCQADLGPVGLDKILYTNEVDSGRSEFFEQLWHRECYAKQTTDNRLAALETALAECQAQAAQLAAGAGVTAIREAVRLGNLTVSFEGWHDDCDCAWCTTLKAAYEAIYAGGG